MGCYSFELFEKFVGMPKKGTKLHYWKKVQMSSGKVGLNAKTNEEKNKEAQSVVRGLIGSLDALWRN